MSLVHSIVLTPMMMGAKAVLLATSAIQGPLNFLLKTIVGMPT